MLFDFLRDFDERNILPDTLRHLDINRIGFRPSGKKAVWGSGCSRTKSTNGTVPTPTVRCWSAWSGGQSAHLATLPSVHPATELYKQWDSVPRYDGPGTPTPGSSAPGPAPRPKPQRTFGFGIKAFKTYPELIPIVAVVSMAVTGCLSFMVYSLMRKPDVQVVRGYGNVPTVWEAVKPDEKRKLRVVRPETYKPIPEVEALKRDIGSYKS